MHTAIGISQLKEMAGSELGVSAWHEVSQAKIDAFAELTGDRQWIHTDPERARTTPFGGTIAHGYYTLALAPVLLAEAFPIDSFSMAVNYGLDKLRFPSPLPVGEKVRMRAALEQVDELPGGASLRVRLTFERSGSEKPVCVATAIYRVAE